MVGVPGQSSRKKPCLYEQYSDYNISSGMARVQRRETFGSDVLCLRQSTSRKGHMQQESTAHGSKVLWCNFAAANTAILRFITEKHVDQMANKRTP